MNLTVVREVRAKYDQEKALRKTAANTTTIHRTDGYDIIHLGFRNGQGNQLLVNDN